MCVGGWVGAGCVCARACACMRTCVCVCRGGGGVHGTCVGGGGMGAGGVYLSTQAFLALLGCLGVIVHE